MIVKLRAIDKTSGAKFGGATVRTRPREVQQFPRWRNVTAAQWRDWRWQLKNRISTPEELGELIPLTPEERSAAERSRTMFRLGITPHYATLIDPDDPDCPIRRQVVPREDELVIAPFEREDPLNEDGQSPVPGLTHRYPDRVLLLLTHECALYCRYCTRRRIVGDHQGNDPAQLAAAIEYIRGHPEIRDVLISGGDPLSVSDRRLEDVLRRLRAIDHVEIIRIGTRLPVVMPQRITRQLVAMLRRYHPLWLNTHFNHPFELAPVETRQAMERLADAGIPTGNQSVLLRGINDQPAVIKKLMHELVKVRCRPYYLYNCDLSQGLSHFRTSIDRGLEIMESLWGHTSGYAIPTFVVDAPGGGGKIPLLPQYIVSHHQGRLTLRNYRDHISTYWDGGANDLVTIQTPQPIGSGVRSSLEMVAKD
ncbi:MAG: KamA family radical SAM protein [Acidobacteriia bacterium]|nr:KamA family radical SAM protein [Terriglobia bacterium]